MGEKIKSYKDLKIWQIGIEVVVAVYEKTKKFPRNEEYGIVTQMKRAAVSIPSNIAEGFRRFHNKEYRQFLYIAMGSLAELETQIIIANKIKFIEEGQAADLLNTLEELSRMIKGLINKL